MYRAGAATNRVENPTVMVATDLDPAGQTGRINRQGVRERDMATGERDGLAGERIRENDCVRVGVRIGGADQVAEGAGAAVGQARDDEGGRGGGVRSCGRGGVWGEGGVSKTERWIEQQDQANHDRTVFT